MIAAFPGYLHLYLCNIDIPSGQQMFFNVFYQLLRRSKAVAPVLVLLFVALWFILRGYLFYVLPCVILFLYLSSSFSIVITSLREERANLSAFRTFVDLRLFGFVCILFLLVSGKGCGL